MKIESKILGEIELEESGIIDFPVGIPAFEEEKKFAIIPFDDKGPFFYLQAINRPELCLIIIDPFTFFPDYRIEVPDEELHRITAGGDQKNISLLSVLTIPKDFKKATANLFAPLLIDTDTNLGMQFIPQSSEYSTRHYIFMDEAAKSKTAAGQGE